MSRRCSRTTADDQGRQLEFVIDEDNDGSFELVQTATYTATGAPLESTMDGNGDGEPELITTHTYDDQGRPLARRSWYAPGSAGLAGASEEAWTNVTTYAYDGDTVTRTSQSFSNDVLQRGCVETSLAGDPMELRCAAMTTPTVVTIR